MSQIIYPRMREIGGPWLLDKVQLSQFEVMIADVTSELQKDLGVAFRFQFSVTFSNGKCIVEDSLESIDLNNDIRDMIPTEIEAKIWSEQPSAFSTHFTLCLENRLLQGFRYDIREKASEDIMLKIINIIDNWVSACRPSKFLMLWNKTQLFFAIIGTCAVFALLLLPMVNFTSEAYKRSLTPQAAKIMEEGVNEQNYMDAIELILAKEYSVTPASFHETNYPLKYAIPIIICIIICFFYRFTRFVNNLNRNLFRIIDFFRLGNCCLICSYFYI